jgi:hypothetical protein
LRFLRLFAALSLFHKIDYVFLSILAKPQRHQASLKAMPRQGREHRDVFIFVCRETTVKANFTRTLRLQTSDLWPLSFCALGDLCGEINWSFCRTSVKMKNILATVALMTILIGNATLASSEINNSGFETGDFLGWETAGDTMVVDLFIRFSGDSVSFDVNFLTNKFTPDPDFNDFAFYTFSPYSNVIADTNAFFFGAILTRYSEQTGFFPLTLHPLI